MYFVFYLLSCGCASNSNIDSRLMSFYCEQDTSTTVPECVIYEPLDMAYLAPKLVDSITFFNQLKGFLSHNLLSSQANYYIFATFKIDEGGNASGYSLTSEGDAEIPISSASFQELIYKTSWQPATYQNKRIKSSVSIFFNLKKTGICSFELRSNTYSRVIFTIAGIPFD